MIGQSLMVAFEMVMLDELAYGPSKMLLAQQHELVQTFGFDREDESFGVGVEIGTVRRELETLDSGGA